MGSWPDSPPAQRESGSETRRLGTRLRRHDAAQRLCRRATPSRRRGDARLQAEVGFLLHAEGAGASWSIIGASLSEPHIPVVVVSISFSVGRRRLDVDVDSTRSDPIAYNRISTWKTGILRARARTPDMKYCAAPPVRALDPAGL